MPDSSAPSSLRDAARRIFHAGVAAANPRDCVSRALTAPSADAPDAFRDLARFRRIRALAFGKAACSMAEGATTLRALPNWDGPGLVVTYYDGVREVEGFRVLGSGHPLPDANGVAGAQAALEFAGELDTEDLLVVLVSGGGSALMPCPADGITLAEKIAATDALLRSGADIHELNTVRKHLSGFKGGGLARAAAPAHVLALLLSDVIGDDESTIASGPTVADPTSFGDAYRVLKSRGLLERVPTRVRERLERGSDGALPETPKPGDAIFERTWTRVIGGNSVSLQASLDMARTELGEAEIFDAAICGEARTEAARFAKAAAFQLVDLQRRPLALLGGGETTVLVRGEGLGGRNQELALALALVMEELEELGFESSSDWVFLSGGTDGRDGPTDAAGGIVDAGTLERMRAAGVDPRRLLDDNDSYHALEAAGDLLRIGSTGTNVADLQVFIAR